MSLAMAERNTTAQMAKGRRPDGARARRESGEVRRVDELLLAYHLEGDRSARDQALVELMPLVRSLAARYAGRGEQIDDLDMIFAGQMFLTNLFEVR